MAVLFFVPLRQVWSAEEEYLIMKVTLNAVRVLRQWMNRYAQAETLLPRYC